MRDTLPHDASAIVSEWHTSAPSRAEGGKRVESRNINESSTVTDGESYSIGYTRINTDRAAAAADSSDAYIEPFYKAFTLPAAMYDGAKTIPQCFYTLTLAAFHHCKDLLNLRTILE